jgi:adenine-specific DNA-methyltransferase
MEERLKRLDLWRLSLGLYPVPLFSDDSQKNQFVLLNGNRGNFCLDLRNEPSSDESRNSAWSANVGHYVSLVNGFVEVQRWDQKQQAIQRYDNESVFRDLEKFHSILERDEPRREFSVVSHVIRVFRSLRTALGNSTDGPNSLKAFLYLLASVTDNVERDGLSTEKWGLVKTAAEIANLVRQADWDALVYELIRGRPLERLTPIPALVLRHASGQLFQEAHYEAIAIPQEQLMLSGFAPLPITLGKRHKGFGLHFTPPALARTLVEEAFSTLESLPPSVTVFDPACGSGEFLREALRQLLMKNYRGRIELIGWDVSPAACDMANFLLSWESRGYESQIDKDIKCRDSVLTDIWPTGVNVVVMNPPFLSWQDMNPEQKDAISGVLGKLSKNRPDLSSAFVLRAASTLVSDGVLASILPASFLDGESAGPVREHLGEILNTKLVGRLGSHQLFMSATVDAALYVGSSDRVDFGAPVAFWADHRPQSASAGLRALRKVRSARGQDALPVLEKTFNIYQNSAVGKGKESWAPRPYEAWKLISRLRSLTKVRALFAVRQGIRTGLNKAFILSKKQWEELPTKRERSYFRPAVVNESIRDGCLDDSAYLFYPYGSAAIQTESGLRSTLRHYYEEFLLPNKEVLSKRGSRREAKWWELSEHRAWQEEPEPKIVSTYFGDAGSFAWDSRGSFLVVQGFGWIHRPTRQFKNLPPKIGVAYLPILNSIIFSRLLSATSNHVGGGQWNLSKRFVGEIPLPNLLSGELDPGLVSELTLIGSEIHSGGVVDANRREQLVSAAYGLDDSI